MTDPRRVGGRYYSAYWRQEYTVQKVDRRNWDTTYFTVEWSDGRITTHCTDWDPRRDKEIHQ